MVWKSVEPEVWKPQKDGEQLVGVLIKAETKTDDLGAKYYFEWKAQQYLVWGSTVLDDRLATVIPGTLVRITYKGEVPNKDKRKNSIKIYKVETSDMLEEE